MGARRPKITMLLGAAILAAAEMPRQPMTVDFWETTT